MLNLEFSIMAVGPSEKLFKGSFHFSIYKLLIPVRVPSWPLWSWFEYILILKPDIRNIISILDNTVYVVLSATTLFYYLLIIFSIKEKWFRVEKYLKDFPPQKQLWQVWQILSKSFWIFFFKVTLYFHLFIII